MSESSLVSVALAGPWWTLLTYRTKFFCETGMRVRVPVGRGSRVGLVIAAGDSVPDDYDGEVREILEAIDERPLLPEATMRLVRWFADTYLCGVGTAMKTLLPAAFLHGDTPLCEPVFFRTSEKTEAGEASFAYDPVDAVRLARYARILSDGLPSLVCFPLYAAAKNFFDWLTASHDFPSELRERLLLFPHTGAKAEWKAWSRLMGDVSLKIVIGAQASAMAPLPGLARVIVEDESNHVWRTMRHPAYNVRSLLSMRARFEGAALVLGGRMPSSRAYLRLAESGELPPKTPRKIFYVDLRAAYSPQVQGVQDSLAVSEPLVRETNAALERGAWAIWILDRKGYAGEIVCDECGYAVRCPRCGGGMRWEASAGSMRCVACGTRAPVPDICPRCRGRLLMARRPGLEALLPLAKAAIHLPVPILSLDAEDGRIPDEVFFSRTGLLLGTRATLALCDKLSVGLVGWIDPDGEARSQEHDARVRAFGLIWESCWRGIDPEDRRILLQSRRPGKDWQRGLSEGWGTFWRDEIRERRQFGLPPFVSLIRLEALTSDAGALCDRLDRAGLEYWTTEEPGAKREIWVRTNKTAALRAALEPFFGIGRAKRGYPGLTVWYE